MRCAFGFCRSFLLVFSTQNILFYWDSGDYIRILYLIEILAKEVNFEEKLNLF